MATKTKKSKKEKVEVIGKSEGLMEAMQEALKEKLEVEEVPVVEVPVSEEIQIIEEVPVVEEKVETMVENFGEIEEEVIQDFIEPSEEDVIPMFTVKEVPEVAKKTKKAKKEPSEKKEKAEVKPLVTPIVEVPKFRDCDRKIVFTVNGKRKTFKGNWVINHNGQLLYSGGKGIMVEGGEIKGLRRFKSTSGEWSSFNDAPVYVRYSTEGIKTYEDLWAKAYQISFEDEYLFIQIKAPKLPKISVVENFEKVTVVEEANV